jgi:hypothetical protein
MAIERKWATVRATPLTADSTSKGVVTVADTVGFKTKQAVYLLANGQAPAQFQVQEVSSSTTLVLGPINPAQVGRQFFSDLSAYTVLSNAVIGASEQDKTANPPEKDHYAAVYESDPILADRVIFVDPYGQYYGEGNPLPIAFDGTIAIGSVEIKGSTGNILEPNADGSINVNIVPSTSTTDNVVISRYGEANAAASGATVQVTTYTVPPNKVSILQKVEMSGENIAKFQILLNGNPISTLRTYFGGELNAIADFTTGQDNGLVLKAGDIVSLTAVHNRPYAADFEGRIQIYQVTLM